MGLEFSPASPAGKWLGFVTAVWVQAISGNNYTFSNYSDALKSLMALTQLQLNNLSVAKDVGKAFGIFAGIASDRLPTPVILLIGSIEGLIGYGVQWLVVSRRIQPLPYWAVSKGAWNWPNWVRNSLNLIFFRTNFGCRCAFFCVWEETARRGWTRRFW